jgi:PhnB protein
MPSELAALETKSSLAPWISVPVGAIDFYKSAFDATEVYHHDDPSGGVVVRLSVNGAEFWLSQESPDRASPIPGPIGGGMIRLILTVPNPDQMFARALKAGARQVYPVSEGHGWRIGRVEDPFGLHWEIGHPLTLPGIEQVGEET